MAPRARFRRRFVAIAASVVWLASPDAQAPAPGSGPAAYEWIQLFNGRDLDGWTPKFATHDLGVNLHETFRVANGLLQVRYDRWSTFNGEFGHLFYKDPFSYYLIAAEYRFVGDQVAGGPAWAMRNNGLMLHSPSPKTMLRDQDFPIALEIQLLGGLGKGARTTANLCTPGSHVVYQGTLHTAHCTNSTSQTYDGDQWVRVEVLVHGDELVRLQSKSTQRSIRQTITSSGAPVRLTIMHRQARTAQDKLFDDPGVGEPFCGYAGEKDERDYSKGSLCKRHLIYLPSEHLWISHRGGRVRVTAPAESAPAVTLRTPSGDSHRASDEVLSGRSPAAPIGALS